jgi:hypothetical protein
MIYWLGADQNAPDPAAYGALFAALRDNMVATWGRAEAAYVTLKKVREQLGLPFIDDSAGTPEQGTAASHGAWTTDLETQAEDLHAMSALIISALDDAVSGKRGVFLNDSGDLAIRQLDTDVVVLAQDAQGVPVLVGGPASANPGQPTHVSAPIGVGVPVIVWAATAVGSVLALPAYFVAEAAMNGLTDVAEQKMVKTLAERSYDCVQSGKCTPEQAKVINDSILTGAAGIRLAKAKEEEAKKPIDWADTLKAAAWVVGIGLVGYALIRFLSAAPARASTTRLLPAARAA